MTMPEAIFYSVLVIVGIPVVVPILFALFAGACLVAAFVGVWITERISDWRIK